MSVKEPPPPPLHHLPPHSPALNGQCQITGITSKIKWKTHVFFTLPFKRFEGKITRHSSQFFCFLLQLFLFTTLQNLIQNYLKKISFLTFLFIFSYLTDSPNPPNSLNCQNPLSMTKLFWRCFHTNVHKQSSWYKHSLNS